MPHWEYYLWTILVVLGSLAGWVSNLVGLPGNWLVLGVAGVFAYLAPMTAPQGVGWQGLAVLLGLALAGEVVEFAASAAGAAKQGASKRAVLLSAVGAMVGGVLGIFAGVPVPLVGSLIGALLASSAGAFVGAYLGQKWARRTESESVTAGRGAFFGRLWGTAGKLIVGLVMLVVLVVDLYFA